MPLGRGGRELHADELAELIERQKNNKVPPVASCYEYSDASLELKLVAGADGANCVLRGYTDKIAAHEASLKAMRASKALARDARRAYKTQSKVAKEAYSAYVTISADAGDLEEEEMDALSHVTFMTEKNAKLKKAGRESEMVPVPTVEEMQAKIDEKKALKERINRLWGVAMREKKKAETMQRASAEAYTDYAVDVREEKRCRDEVTPQHRLANRRGVTLMSLYPKAHIWDGMISINDIQVWGLQSKEIFELLAEEPGPHTIEWGRYNYREDIFGRWYSFAELRALKKWVPEPEREDELFIQACARNDQVLISEMFKHGHELRINMADRTGATAMHVAVANGHAEVVARLLEEGADPRMPNHNGYTPWFLCVSRGDLALVQLFAEHACNVNDVDKQGHSVLCRALMAAKTPADLELSEFLVRKGANLLYINRIWGWTMLHYAAKLGSVPFCEKVLNAGASPYYPSKRGWTAAMVAKDCGHEDVVEYLRQHIFKEPGQLIGKYFGGELWVGSRDAAKRRWADARGIDAVLSLKEDPEFHYTGLSYLDDDDTINSLPLWVIEDPNGSKSGKPKWDALVKVLLRAHSFIHENVKKHKRHVLIHCDEGTSTSIAVLCHYLMTKGQMRYRDAIAMVKKIRPCAAPSEELERALLEFEEEVGKRRGAALEAKMRDSIMISLGFNPTRGADR
eukprot:g382.t1